MLRLICFGLQGKVTSGTESRRGLIPSGNLKRYFEVTQIKAKDTQDKDLQDKPRKGIDDLKNLG